jgi:hypothetical protein
MYHLQQSKHVLRFGALFLLFAFGSCNSSSGPSAETGDAAQKADTIQKEEGFVNLFDGKTLDGWRGDTAVWKMKDGIVTGEVTASSTPLKSNTFLIWNGGSPADFELKGEYRISSEGNSGIQYRSSEVENVPYGLKGYQFDIDGANQYTGQNYEERVRAIMAFRGQKVTLPEVTGTVSSLVKNNVWTPSVVTGALGNPDSLKAHINAGWNDFHLIIKGNHLQHYINGFLMCDVTDNDTANRKSSGLLGLQLHAGHIMKIEFRNLRIKEIQQ